MPKQERLPQNQRDLWKTRFKLQEHLGMMSLAYGEQQVGIDHFPRVNFTAEGKDGKPILNATDCNSNEGRLREQWRPATLEEIKILVVAANAFAPNSSVTTALHTRVLEICQEYANLAALIRG